ncbi:protein trichome birefringence-like 43 [Senna tora]|uniref:Protein trichome birefringence-like 43 n=1 Tax=Senna tora TaxID=362788 RepID=A0A834T5Q4_9FABA|nr:protein trichome birefringence-like 43 [Senna tora]
MANSGLFMSIVLNILLINVWCCVFANGINAKVVTNGGSTEKCDLFQGSWVYDEWYGSYEPSDCGFIEKQFDCLDNGRLDKFYLRYRWQPSSCNLPRYVPPFHIYYHSILCGSRYRDDIRNND